MNLPEKINKKNLISNIHPHRKIFVETSSTGKTNALPNLNQ